MGISNELLAIMACPKCKGEIKLNEKNDGLTCNTCKLLFPIVNDIPTMLIDEATDISGSAK